MRRQILQLFQNLISSEKGHDGKTEEQNPGTEFKRDADWAKEGADDGKDVPGPVKMLDRKTFERIVNEDLCEGRREGCLLIGDVDRCRDINDIYGHDIGDAVLRYVADVLCDVFADHACIGCQGSDIFALWLPRMSRDNMGDIRVLTGIVNDRLLHPVRELPPSSLSMGVAFHEPDDDWRRLAKRANKALYLVKESGRCGCELAL